MKNIPYILLILLSACFDPGASPKTKQTKDLVNKDSNTKDMARDTKIIDRDLPSSDLGKDDMIVVRPDTSTDMKTDVAIDTGAPDLGAMCNGLPVDVKTDVLNCGMCGNVCDQDFANSDEGSCKCPMDAQPCGANNKCLDTRNDPLNCGACGNSCGLAAQCVNSACVCLNDLRDCNGKCVNLRSDPLNCGDCDEVCDGDKSSCNNGSCERTCLGGGWSCDVANGKTYCGTRPDIFTCNSRALDRCGTECGVGETCEKNEGFSITYRCRKRKPTIDCQTCPCPECNIDDEECVISPLAGNEVFVWKNKNG